MRSYVTCAVPLGATTGNGIVLETVTSALLGVRVVTSPMGMIVSVVEVFMSWKPSATVSPGLAVVGFVVNGVRMRAARARPGPTIQVNEHAKNSGTM
jgi:hypothetical protein